MMTPGPARRLSRVLVRCHPRRWRDRYREEMLDVLDQHQPTVRTMVNLWASAISAHLDPAYRTEGFSPRLRRAARIPAAAVGSFALLVTLFGLIIYVGTAKECAWHVGLGGVTAMAFSPVDQHILVTATSGNLDGVDTLWDVISPSRPRGLRHSHRTATRSQPSRSTTSRPCGTSPISAGRPG
jgi:hypothetical protein